MKLSKSRSFYAARDLNGRLYFYKRQPKFDQDRGVFTEKLETLVDDRTMCKHVKPGEVALVYVKPLKNYKLPEWEVVRDQVYIHFRASPTSRFTVFAVAADYGCSQKVARRALDWLVKAGHLRRDMRSCIHGAAVVRAYSYSLVGSKKSS